MRWNLTKVCDETDVGLTYISGGHFGLVNFLNAFSNNTPSNAGRSGSVFEKQDQISKIGKEGAKLVVRLQNKIKSTIIT